MSKHTPEPWKRVSASASIDVEVELWSFSRAQLLQALINDHCITAEEAAILLARKGAPHAALNADKRDLILDEMARAREEMESGRRGEALIHLERALGHPFIGAFQ